MRLLSLSKYTDPEHRIGSLSVVEGSICTAQTHRSCAFNYMKFYFVAS